MFNSSHRTTKPKHLASCVLVRSYGQRRPAPHAPGDYKIAAATWLAAVKRCREKPSSYARARACTVKAARMPNATKRAICVTPSTAYVGYGLRAALLWLDCNKNAGIWSPESYLITP